MVAVKPVPATGLGSLRNGGDSHQGEGEQGLLDALEIGALLPEVAREGMPEHGGRTLPGHHAALQLVCLRTIRQPYCGTDAAPDSTAAKTGSRKLLWSAW